MVDSSQEFVRSGVWYEQRCYHNHFSAIENVFAQSYPISPPLAAGPLWHGCGRRTFLKGAIVGGLAVSPGVRALESRHEAEDAPVAVGFWHAPRWVWLKRASTGHEIRLEYWRDGVIDEGAYRAISWFLRDLRFERMMGEGSAVIQAALREGRISQRQVSPWMLMDPVLLDILYAYSAWLRSFGVARPLLVTSALRHPLVNAMTEGAARDSWHTLGAAADIVIEGVATAQVARFGRWLSGGGVGLYPQRHFVHVDRGKVRSWVG